MRRISFVKLSLLILCFVFSCVSAAAQTNEFTYQGKLTDTGTPQTAYDFEFRLCASDTGDCTMSPPSGGLLETKQRLGVLVSNGIFTVKLDFLETHFTGADRFLQISVRRNSGETWTQLSPRQKITSAPYSIKSLNAATSDNSLRLGGTLANQYVLTTDTRLSDDRNPLPNSTNYIQNRTTPQPNSSFSVTSGSIGGSLRIEGSGFILPNTPSLSLGGNGIFQIDAPFLPSGRFVVLENGNVGIGNGEPTEKLQVAGNVSASGTLTAAQYNIGGSRVLSVAGANNLFAGINAGAENTGNSNSFVGASAGANNTTGRQNSFVGFNAGASNMTGINNSFVGFNAGANNTTGFTNSFFGVGAGFNNTTGSNNTIIGSANVGADNLTFATALGSGALVNNSNSVVLGRSADTVRIPGNLSVTGSISKGSGSFKIDHPLDPQNKYLSHSFVESPDMMNVYNGNITTDEAGEATITLPDYFEALNRDFRYQLTVIGQFAQAIVGEEIKGNQFKIKTDKPGVKVSWQVTGIRQDKFAEENRIPTEEDKPLEERGRCLFAPLCNGVSINDSPFKP